MESAVTSHSGFDKVGVNEMMDIEKQSGKVSIFAHKQPKDLKWSNVTFSVGSKFILKDCWGVVESGTMTAVLGPSGCGKTSLLNVIAGRSASGHGIVISGRINIGGNDIDPVKYRQNIAYVMQEDTLMPTATPREALTFSAKLRLHHQIDHTDIHDHVSQLIEALGLESCADVKIGGPLVKGISGGQKKRTSIGIELITDPQVDSCI